MDEDSDGVFSVVESNRHGPSGADAVRSAPPGCNRIQNAFDDEEGSTHQSSKLPVRTHSVCDVVRTWRTRSMDVQ